MFHEPLPYSFFYRANGYAQCPSHIAVAAARSSLYFSGLRQDGAWPNFRASLLPLLTNPYSSRSSAVT
ncbi:protein of unknown function [Methylocaldum szegediense]|uniref:Uncharacterized protein n=1 Tax=Methylocaldum szegediense TaxID=73780 RepID=A0ABN8X840_9GAMM|nr:protein of unknown function [Methylocaldum szegediense]